MRVTRYAAAFFLLGISAALAQEPAPAEGGLHNKPLTPAEQREKDIKVYDPLDKSNPTITTPDERRSDTPDPTSSAAAVVQTPAATPLPGSVAASNTVSPAGTRRGPQVISDAFDTAPVQDYTGPAVLSRSYTISRPMAAQQLKLLPTLGVSEVYDTGLTGGVVNSNGTLQNVGAFGTLLNWGLTGRHFWRHDQAGIQYTGSYNHYGSRTGYSGANQFLNADFSHQFTRHWTLTFVESGSITSQGYALINQDAIPSSIADINLAASPTTQILDQGMRQFMSTVDMTWQKSSRLSFNFGGGGFDVDRTGDGLFGNTGYQARADMNYRYTRRLTLGLYYSFTDYTFARHIEISTANTFGGLVSYAFNRSSQLRLRGGVTRAEDQWLVTVPIDPAIAALIGRSTAIVDNYHLSLLSDISAELVKDFGRSRTANVSYTRGIAPGNGVLLTSIQEIESASFSMRLSHRYIWSATGGRTSLSSVSQTIGKYGTEYVGSSLNRTFDHGLSANFGFDYRRFSMTNGATLHNQFRITSGITWGPTEGRLW